MEHAHELPEWLHIFEEIDILRGMIFGLVHTIIPVIGYYTGWSINRFLKKNRNYNVISQVGTLLIIEKRDSTPPSVTEVSFVDRLWAMGLAPWFQLKASLDKRIKRASRDA